MFAAPTPPACVVLHGDDPSHDVQVPGATFARLVDAASMRFAAFDRDGAFTPGERPINGLAGHLARIMPGLEADVADAAGAMMLLALVSRRIGWRAA